MSIVHRVSKPFLRSLVAYIEGCDIDAEPLLSSVGLSRDELNNGDEFLPGHIYSLLLKEGAALSTDPAFGLHFGQSAESERWGVLGYIMTCCSTLVEAMFCLKRYQDLVGSMGTLIVNPVGDALRMIWDTDFQPLSIQAEETVTGWVTFGRWVTNEHLAIDSVHFSHGRPLDAKPYEDFFQCPVVFDSSFNGLEVQVSVLNTPLKQPDDKMKGWLMQHADDRLKTIEEPQTFLSQVKRYIQETLPMKLPELAEISELMEMNPRTFQRRLEKKGCNFSSFVEEVRHELAIQHLGQSNYSITDIAFLLGYSEQSAFSRAFKRRTGMTPSEFIQQNRVRG